MSTPQIISVLQSTDCGGGGECLRQPFATEAEMCERVKRKTAAIAGLKSIETFRVIGGAERGLVPTADPLVIGSQQCLAVNLTAPVYFKINEVDKLYDGKDKCSCEGCKDSIEFEVEGNDAVMTNYPIVELAGQNVDPELQRQILYNAATPNVVTCTKSIPVRCCCKGGSNGPDFVEYGITICYTIGILSPLCFETPPGPPQEPTDLRMTVVYAVQVRRLDRTHYRAVDCADGTPGFRTWSKEGVKNIIVPPSTAEIVEAITTDPQAVHAAHAQAHGHKCKPCPPPDPCDCDFTKVKIPYVTIAEFRVKTDEPCRVCGVECECPMKKDGVATDCHTRCRQCKVAKVAVGVPFYLPPDFVTAGDATDEEEEV